MRAKPLRSIVERVEPPEKRSSSPHQIREIRRRSKTSRSLKPHSIDRGNNADCRVRLRVVSPSSSTVSTLLSTTPRTTTMMSFASPILTEPMSGPSSQQESPTSARSRRIAILPPPPPPETPSPPVPARSPLRPTPRVVEAKPPADPALSKRKHALMELLSSERAYASDLALIRDIHIPLALGQPAPFPTPGLPESSSSPPSSPLGPPMTKEDTRVIFGNVEELAVFSEVFCDKLEETLHDVLDPDGDGEDRVGELFLSMIPHLKPPYMTYITRHPSALAHLNSLPQTPALTAYLAQTHTLAQSYTHAWDLPSLLIKPVQRLLKYPLLLAAIMDDTEPGEARDKLREARDKVEEVARGVNEGRRRWEVVKGVLDGKHPPPVRLKSMKGFKLRSGSKDDQDQLERLEKRLHECEKFVHEFAKEVVDWTMSLRDTISQLERWSINFGRVIGLGQPHGSEALDLFTEIISTQITPIWISLEAAIQTTLLPKLARLLATTAQPLLLISHMHALRPQHLQLLDAPISKTRPPTSLLDASQSYLALDAQLRAELPRYIELLERGFLACLCQFSDWQGRFWREVRGQWVELWDALGVEGDMNAGAADTVKVWWERWEEVDAAAAKLGITRPRRDRTSRASTQSHTTGPAAALATAFVSGPAPAVAPSSPGPSLRTPSANPRRHSMQSIDLEIDMHVLSISRSPGMTTSPDAYSPMSPATTTSSRRRSSASRRESERLPPSRRISDRPPDRPSTARPEYSTPRTSTDRPQTARRHTRHSSTDQPVLPKKASVDSAASLVSSPLSLGQPSRSSRTSIHTSGSSGSLSASRSSLNNRLSTHSVDLGLDMHLSGPSSRTAPASQSNLRPYGTPPIASISDLVSASQGFVPVLPVMPRTSVSSKKKKAADAADTAADEPEGRGRTVKKPSMRQRFTDVFRSPSKRPTRASTPSFSTPELPRPPSAPPSVPSSVPPSPPPAVDPGPEVVLPADPLYTCTVIHPFTLPDHVPQTYRGLPFLALILGDTLEVLSEEGHPRDHETLPIRPEDDSCDECLLVARHEGGTVGWALASFLVVLS